MRGALALLADIRSYAARLAADVAAKCQ